MYLIWSLVVFSIINLLNIESNRAYCVTYGAIEIGLGVGDYRNIYIPPISFVSEFGQGLQDSSIDPFKRANGLIIPHEGARHVGVPIYASASFNALLSDNFSYGFKFHYSIAKAIFASLVLNLYYSSSTYHDYGLRSYFWYSGIDHLQKINLRIGGSIALAIQDYFNAFSGHRAHSVLANFLLRFGAIDFLRTTLELGVPVYNRFGYYSDKLFSSKKLSSADYTHKTYKLIFDRHINHNFILFLKISYDQNYLVIEDVKDYKNVGFNLNTILGNSKELNLSSRSIFLGFRMIVK